MDLIPYYSGNIRRSKCIGHITYEQFVERHKNPNKRTRVLMEKINAASLAKDIELKKSLKGHLFAFTPSVEIEVGMQRGYKNMKGFTQYKQLDFDKIEDKETAIQIKNHVFEYNPEILCAYLSPSGLGVKCLLKTVRCQDIEQFRAMHKAIETHFSAYGDYFDSAVKNAILPLFLSADSSILHRSFNEAKAWKQEDWSKTKYVALNDSPTDFGDRYSNRQKQYFLNKTIRIFKSKLSLINQDGHPQLRSACLILGSRCGAGYIDVQDAETLAEEEIKSNQYLQKDIKNYILTSVWAINEGKKNPKDY